MIKTRLNTRVETTVRGYPEVGPYDTEQEAWGHVGIELPGWATIVSVHKDNEGWWAAYTCTTTTLRDFEEG